MADRYDELLTLICLLHIEEATLLSNNLIEPLIISSKVTDLLSQFYNLLFKLFLLFNFLSKSRLCQLIFFLNLLILVNLGLKILADGVYVKLELFTMVIKFFLFLLQFLCLVIVLVLNSLNV